MRRTKTIELEETNHLISVEVNRDGDVVEATMFAAHMESTPIDCTEAVRNSKFYSVIIAHKYADLDWTDKGDESFEQFRESLAKIVGVKPA